MKKQSSIVLGLLIISQGVMSCGALKSSESSDSDEKVAESGDKKKSSQDGFQLKGASLLASHSETVFGPKMDLVTSAEDNKKESIFAKYQNNFGTDAGLKIEDKFSDAPTESYFLALSIAGDAIARSCEIDVSSKEEKSLCFCSTPDAAKALLTRALPDWDFNEPERQDFVNKFTAGCKNGYRATIGGLINSLAFVQR